LFDLKGLPKINPRTASVVCGVGGRGILSGGTRSTWWERFDLRDAVGRRIRRA